MTQYIDFYALTELQTETFKIVDEWSKKNTVPIPHQEILKQLKDKGISKDNAIYSIRSLIKKGYIRKAIIISNKSSYVRLRSL